MIGKLLKSVGISDENIGKSAFLNSLLPDYVPWMPSSFIVSITNKCNYKCVMCCIGSGDIERMNMDREVFRRASRYFKNKSVTFVGGEPLLHPDLLEFLQIYHFANARVNIVTNGSLLTEGWVDTLTQFPNLTLTISIDGVGDNYNRIRVNGNFETVIKNLKRINRKDLVSVNLVGMKSNIDDLPKLIEIVGDYVNSVQVVHPLCYSQDIADQHLNRDIGHANGIFRESIAIATEYNVRLTLPNFKPRARGCINPWALPIIGLGGDVYPCHILVGSDQRKPVPEYYEGTCVTPPVYTSMGNIMESDFMQIWNGKKMRQFRRELRRISVSSLKSDENYVELRGDYTNYCQICPSRWGVAC